MKRHKPSRDESKLKLRKQTLRTLSTNELSQVAGGTWGGGTSISTIVGDDPLTR
jgi:bacteriocin-like protein